ncbi:MAG: substrate-binding domain-containing protein [Christensenellaceae bacterium]|nr:substrate-binding domain-containing protein [Christensenellaceae bacterium]
MKKLISLCAALTLTVFTGCATTTPSSAPATSTPAAATSAPTQAPVAEDAYAGKAITVVSREDGSGTRGAFIELFGIEVKNDDGSKKDTTTKEAVIANQTGVMLTNIAGDPYAIGYVSLGSLDNSVKALSIESVVASVENVKNKSYAIMRPFNIATKAEISELAQDFIGFILSAEGQAVITDGKYIAVDAAAKPYAGSKPAGKIVVAGSSSVTPIMEKLKEAYLAINAGAEIEIQMSDSSAGMTAAKDGTCDIGMASRELKETEAAELTATAIALDGIAVIVNSGNPATDLSKDQVKAIFTGEAVTWSDIK